MLEGIFGNKTAERILALPRAIWRRLRPRHRHELRWRVGQHGTGTNSSASKPPGLLVSRRLGQDPGLLLESTFALRRRCACASAEGARCAARERTQAPLRAPATAATIRQAGMTRILATHSREEIAALVCAALERAGVSVVLSGGAVVSRASISQRFRQWSFPRSVAPEIRPVPCASRGPPHLKASLRRVDATPRGVSCAGCG